MFGRTGQPHRKVRARALAHERLEQRPGLPQHSQPLGRHVARAVEALDDREADPAGPSDHSLSHSDTSFRGFPSCVFAQFHEKLLLV